MKKAIRITGNVIGALSILAFLGSLAVGLVIFLLQEDIVREAIRQGVQYPEESIRAAVKVMGLTCIVCAVYLLVAVVFDFILAVKAGQDQKSIALAIVAIVFGATVPGVLYLINAIQLMHRKPAEPKPEQ